MGTLDNVNVCVLCTVYCHYTVFTLYCSLLLCSSSDDGTCRIWDAKNSQQSPQIYIPSPSESVAGCHFLSFSAWLDFPTFYFVKMILFGLIEWLQEKTVVQVVHHPALGHKPIRFFVVHLMLVAQSLSLVAQTLLQG